MVSVPTTAPATHPRRVLLVAENMSMKQSGETSIPCYYLEHFLRRGIEVWAICHSRVRDELRDEMRPEVFRRIHFVEDTWLQRRLWRAGHSMHYRVDDLIFGQLIHTLTQLRMRSFAERLIDRHDIQLVFQPVPISPKALSYMFGFNVPVVVGPMCGGLELPPAFRHIDGRLVSWSIRLSRLAAGFMHRFVPGKLQAAALLVGNRRTARVLPRGIRGRVFELVESGVDLDRWPPKQYPAVVPGGVVRFVFCGRLVDWKGAQYLVKAFAPLARKSSVHLDLIGDGELFESIRAQVRSEGIADSVTLHGRVPLDRCIDLMRNGDAYVVPSLRECGGLALLEAMALGLPIVATNWMGPAEYLDDRCGILVDPSTEQGMIEGFTAAMDRLAQSPALRQRLGENARKKVCDSYFGWEKKVTRVIEIFDQVLAARPSAAAPRRA